MSLEVWMFKTPKKKAVFVKPHHFPPDAKLSLPLEIVVDDTNRIASMRICNVDFPSFWTGDRILRRREPFPKNLLPA